MKIIYHDLCDKKPSSDAQIPQILKKGFQNWTNDISTSNHMFSSAIWDKLPECIFENSEFARVKRGHFQNFQKSRGWFIPKIAQIKHVVTG